ncbi:hypothetical protein E2C01_042385 [Portunus trituberculatus]|uniref:Uncharacterized protein n=1 Tax=Portunus trituberculatus TaxID=210409 RepID=A0A5B7FTB7_PORTR|nr:hypothetical protein [Portunus trituberculatus]
MESHITNALRPCWQIRLTASSMPYNSQNVELEETGRLRPTQPCGGGSTSGENTAQPAVPSGCRDPSVYTWSSPGPVDDMVAIVDLLTLNFSSLRYTSC